MIRINRKESLRWKNIRLNILICAGITFLLTVLFYMMNSSITWKSFFHTVIFSYCIGFSIYFTMTGLVIELENKLAKFAVDIIKLVFSTIIGVIAAWLIFIIVYHGQSLSISGSSIVFILISGVIFGVAATLLFYFYHLSEERKYRQLQEQEEKTKAELRALVSQINPHFLFNTLNSISYLIHTEPVKADEMLMKLSDVFRYSLQSGKKKFVSIAEELKIVKQYLEIEKIRLSNRLSYRFDIDPQCQEYSIPPLILQTLAENSVKHGISSKLEGGSIFISVKDRGEDIEIIIEDDGVGMQPHEISGFGLKAVKNILKLQYKKHEFDLRNENGVKIRILIPKVEER